MIRFLYRLGILFVGLIVLIGLLANIANGDLDIFGIIQLLLLCVIIYLVRFLLPKLLKN